MLFWYASLRLSIQGRILHIPSYSPPKSLRFPTAPPLPIGPSTFTLGHLQCWLIAPYGPQCLPLHSLSRISLCYTLKLPVEGLKLSWAFVFTVSDLWQFLKTEFHYLNCKSDKVRIVSVPSFSFLLNFLLLNAKSKTLSKQICTFKSLFQIKSTVTETSQILKELLLVLPLPSFKGG